MSREDKLVILFILMCLALVISVPVSLLVDQYRETGKLPPFFAPTPTPATVEAYRNEDNDIGLRYNPRSGKLMLELAPGLSFP